MLYCFTISTFIFSSFISLSVGIPNFTEEDNIIMNHDIENLDSTLSSDNKLVFLYVFDSEQDKS